MGKKNVQLYASTKPVVRDENEDIAAAAAVAEAHPLRSIENLYVHADTLACALKQRCIPCGYKIVLNARPGLMPNQRPEMCPRIIKGDNSSKAETPEKGTPTAPIPATTTAAPANDRCAVGFYDDSTVQRMLTVGDGNFSFSLALARAFSGSSSAGVELVVTSHESRASVVETYPDGETILQELAAMKHVQVHHEVDATNATQMHKFGTFDRILWNFPCVRVPRGKDGQNEDMEMNKTLLNNFFAHISKMLTPTGEVHVTHKTKPPFSQWGMTEIAARNSLVNVQSMVFDRCLYPGYSNKKVLSKGSFPIWDSQTFVFVPQPRAEAYTPQLVVGLEPLTKELLEKVYFRLAPTYEEKLEQEARLSKLRQRQQDPTPKSAKAMAQQKRKTKNKSKLAAAKETPGGVSKKRKPAALHLNQKGLNKRLRR